MSGIKGASLAIGGVALTLGLLMPAPPADWDPGDGLAWPAAEAGSCPKGMVSVAAGFCIDRYEAATVIVDAPRRGKHRPKVLRSHSPYKGVTGEHVMAVSEKGKVPQAHISRDEAELACVNAGKRLCTDDEWIGVCKGKKPTQYPYGNERVDGACNDRGVSGFNLLFGPGNNTPPEPSAYNVENMNDPRLNQVEGSLAKSGAFPKCKTGLKVYDMVGNLHEWTSAVEGTFRGGYYLDTSINGAGCDYRTTAHDRKYHDYSTGFRCCAGGDEQARVEKLFVKVPSKKAKEQPNDKLAKSAKPADKSEQKNAKTAKTKKAGGKKAKTAKKSSKP